MPAVNTIAALAAAATLVAAAGSVRAADLPVRTAPPPYVAPLPVFTWTGGYFGVNAGAAFDNESRGVNAPLTAANTGIAVGERPGSVKFDDTGFAVGAQIGYNYEFLGFGGPGSGIVVGFEADADYTDLAKSASYPGLDGYNSMFRSGLNFLGTVRGRIGYAFNQFLIYGTGGFAYGDVFNKDLLYAPNSTTVRFFGSHDNIQTGYAAGGGVEYALPTGSFLNFFKSSAVTIKAEYLYYDLGSSAVSATPVVAGSNGGYSTRFKTDGNLARVGLNYKF
ncbi:outer membrane protein [Lichenibacterium dinghuense]|uniref:outer membrane protein n=1 Tax=Lichenibacterium dinghuense TaxID=2895977 RepID=UPI001F2A6804|nr:porin family protein [Lichenibacterium sp. 6Y81]